MLDSTRSSHVRCTGTALVPALAAVLLLFASSLPAVAQQHDPSMHEEHMRQLSGGSASTSPYVEISQRAIKSLSDDEIRALREGEGMGFALAAELNGYPGPKHVLELAQALELTSDQRLATEQIFDRMAVAARRLGEQLVSAEERLDRAFADGSIDRQRLGPLTADVAEIRGELRAVHLRAHLDMMQVLTREQIADYVQRRGYSGP